MSDTNGNSVGLGGLVKGVLHDVVKELATLPVDVVREAAGVKRDTHSKSIPANPNKENNTVDFPKQQTDFNQSSSESSDNDLVIRRKDASRRPDYTSYGRDEQSQSSHTDHQNEERQTGREFSETRERRDNTYATGSIATDDTNHQSNSTDSAESRKPHIDSNQSLRESSDNDLVIRRKDASRRPDYTSYGRDEQSQSSHTDHQNEERQTGREFSETRERRDTTDSTGSIANDDTNYQSNSTDTESQQTVRTVYQNHAKDDNISQNFESSDHADIVSHSEVDEVPVVMNARHEDGVGVTAPIVVSETTTPDVETKTSGVVLNSEAPPAPQSVIEEVWQELRESVWYGYGQEE